MQCLQGMTVQDWRRRAVECCGVWFWVCENGDETGPFATKQEAVAYGENRDLQNATESR